MNKAAKNVGVQVLVQNTFSLLLGENVGVVWPGHDQKDFIQGIKLNHVGSSETIQRLERQEDITTPREEATINHVDLSGQGLAAHYREDKQGETNYYGFDFTKVP